MLTTDKLIQILPNSRKVAANFIDPLNEVFAAYAINNAKRQACFIAQIGHESQQLLKTSENLNYGAEGLAATWPNRYSVVVSGKSVPNDLAKSIARNPEAIANATYCDRGGNGNRASGDGWRYRGRGLIMLTFRETYRNAGRDLGFDFEGNPDMVAQPLYAVLSAAWFWKKHNLNAYADKDQITLMSKIINGGTNGLEDRKLLWNRGLKVLA